MFYRFDSHKIRTGGRRMWGGADTYRTAQEQYQYLLRCANTWETGSYTGTEEPEQAARVREIAARFKDKHLSEN